MGRAQREDRYLGSESVPVNVFQQEGKVLGQSVGKMTDSERKAQEERQRPVEKTENPYKKKRGVYGD